MTVIVIMACALIGSAALIVLAGAGRWSLVYLICYRMLKREPNSPHFAVSIQRDVLAVIIAIATLLVVAALLIFGEPFVAEHFSELPILPSA